MIRQPASAVEKFIFSVLPCVWFGAGFVAAGGAQQLYSNLEIGLLMGTLVIGGATLLWSTDELR